MELLLMIDGAKRASAYKVIAVIPYFGYARQDRKDKPRVSIGAKLMADLLSAAGVDRVIAMDLHADQIQGFFNVPVDHLFASALFIPFIRNLGLHDITIASPDVGGTKRANTYARLLETDMVICHKSRAKANVVDSLTLIGEVAGKDVIIVDDMIDTAGPFPSRPADDREGRQQRPGFCFPRCPVGSRHQKYRQFRTRGRSTSPTPCRGKRLPLK